jgi:hypothetical protein
VRVSKFLLIVHLLAVVLAVGPVTVAASMFAPAARAVLDATDSAADPPRAVLRTLLRICRMYSVLGLFVPVFGLATALSLGVLANVWVLTSIGLTVGAAGVLILLVLPGQAELVAGLDSGAGESLRPNVSRLGMTTGVFNLLWFTVLVLMVVRPGSTTGA